ncbi:putative cyclodipeptide synthase PUL1 [Kluyveromyces marxianus]
MIAFLEWNTDNIRGTIAETFPKTHNKPAQNKNDLIWDVTDLKVVLEFLFCSHFLSKNKIYNKKGNLDSVTIDFNLAFEKRQSLSKTFHCQGSGKHGIGCRYLKHANESKGSFISVVSKLQSRLASLSIAFLKSKSIVSCNIDSLIKYSPKHVPAMPNFLHFLILEREWGKKRTPILLAVRTFHGNEHCDIYFEARVKQHTFEWILQKQEYDKFEHHIPYLIITAVVTSSNTTKTAQQFAYELMKAQKKFRKFWLTFMSQHRQYPFEIDYDEEQLLKAQVSQDIFELYFSSKRENIDNILFDDHSSFLPKHIFTEYPSIFFNFQKNSDSKYGALVI